MKLTKRKLEVLRLIVNGYSNRQIALNLGISVNTVAVHRASIMKEMGAHKATDLVVRAIRSSLVSVSPIQNAELDAEPESVESVCDEPGKRWVQ